ncbi:hypothetical protein CBP51_01980 [Cellvibrio mixtus]|uniref:Uncharacterized protein n=1 Tax=Cellvibrio mixtus TaxID=39650 RepID=A0A266Q7H2_9GAMM|nr:hypothetical protein CBP51_01980 [Cellvibrio mixtus]
MTLHNDSTTLDRDDAFIAQDLDIEDSDLLLAEEEEMPKPAASSASELSMTNTARRSTLPRST